LPNDFFSINSNQSGLSYPGLSIAQLIWMVVQWVLCLEIDPALLHCLI